MAALAPFLSCWRLKADGRLMTTATSLLLPVRQDSRSLMLKVARHSEEARGNRLMVWYDGDGAAPVVARRGACLLLLRGGPSLAELSQHDDHAATRHLCAVAQALHRGRARPPPRLVTLRRWFADLLTVRDSPVSAMARALLDDDRDQCPLHGDLHHGNVLWFEETGWGAIDPKGLLGHRAFDYANLFLNPTARMAADPARFLARLRQVSEQANLPELLLLRWIVVWATLSALWHKEEGSNGAAARAVAALAGSVLASRS